MTVRKMGLMGRITTLFVLLTWIAAPLAAEESNRYLTIVDRNPFALKEPPPPPPPVEDDATTIAPIPKAIITLTGITSIFDRHKALFIVTDPTGGTPPQKFIRSEGVRIDDIEVVSIDFEKNEVLFKTSDGTTNVTFPPIQSAAVKTPPKLPTRRGRPLPGRPNISKTPGVAPPATAGSPTVIGRNRNGPGRQQGVTVLGGNNYNAPAAPAQTTRGAASYNASATAANRLRNIPSRTRRAAPNQGSPAVQPQQDAPPTFNAEQLRMWIEANKQNTPQLPWPTAPGTPGAPGAPGGQ